MLNERIEALTARLEQVQLEQDRLREQEQQTIKELVAVLQERRDTNVAGAKPPSPGRDKKQKGTSAKQQDKFDVGDRVRIKNLKPRRSGVELTDKDRTGTVSRKSRYFIFCTRITTSMSRR